MAEYRGGGGGVRCLDGPGDEEAKIFITATLLEKLKKLKLLTNYERLFDKYSCCILSFSYNAFL